MPVLRRAATALFAFGLAVPACAADPAAETTSVRVIRPATSSPAGDRRLERRIAAAALEVCGASPYSAAEMKAAVARSRCWRDSYAGGIAQLGGGVTRVDVASLVPPSRERP